MRASCISAVSFVILAVLGGCGPGRTSLPEEISAPPGPSRVRFLNGQAAPGIPFRLVDDAIVLSVRVNSALTVDMILDTALPLEGALFLDPGLGEQLGLNYSRRVSLGGGGRGRLKTADLAVGATLELPGVAFTDQQLLVLRDHEGVTNWHSHGILGRTLMGLTVEIDYAKRVLNVFSRPAAQLQDPGEMLHLAFAQGIPAVSAIVVVDGGKEVPIDLLVDTGANEALILREASHPDLRPPQRVLQGVTGVVGEGLNGEMRGAIGRVSRLRLGAITLDNPVSVFVDEASMGTAATLGRNGILGNKALERFTVVFDSQAGQLYLKPNAAFGRPFDFDMAGLVLQARGDGSFSILDVIRDSPAHRAGIEGGDVLVAVGGKELRGVDSEEVFAMLRKPGTRIALTIARGRERLKRTVRLERLI